MPTKKRRDIETLKKDYTGKRATPQEARVASKYLTALEMRKAGASYKEIARELDYADESFAAKVVKEAITAWIPEQAYDVLQLELARLDDLQRSQWDTALNHEDPRARLDAARFIVDSIMKRRASLQGLDAPDKVIQATLTADLNDEDLIARANAIISEEGLCQLNSVIDCEKSPKMTETSSIPVSYEVIENEDI